MTKWQCYNPKQGTNQGTKCTQHQITVSNIYVFITWLSKGYLSWMEALPHVSDSQRWLTDRGKNYLIYSHMSWEIWPIIFQFDLYAGNKNATHNDSNFLYYHFKSFYLEILSYKLYASIKGNLVLIKTHRIASRYSWAWIVATNVLCITTLLLQSRCIWRFVLKNSEVLSNHEYVVETWHQFHQN